MDQLSGGLNPLSQCPNKVDILHLDQIIICEEKSIMHLVPLPFKEGPYPTDKWQNYNYNNNNCSFWKEKRVIKVFKRDLEKSS